MKDSFPQKLDPQSIRQGLINIRNSQIQLLKQLKSETLQLKKSPVRLESSTQDSNLQQNTKTDYLAYSPQSISRQARHILTPSHLPLQKPFSFGFTSEKKNQSQNLYLKEQNKMLNETLQKLLASRSIDKQRIRDLQSYVYFSQKMFAQIIKEFVHGSTGVQILKLLEHDLSMNRDIYSKYKDSNHLNLLDIIKYNQFVYKPEDIQQGNEKERSLLRQIEQLRRQLTATVKFEHQKNENKATFEIQNSRLRQHNEILRKKCEELQKEIDRKDNDNKELAIFWQRENHQRKAVVSQLEKLKKEHSKSEQTYEQIIHLEKDLIKKQMQLRQKETSQSNIHQNMKRLSEAMQHFKQQNQKLKRQIKSIQQIKEIIRQEEHSRTKQAQNEMKTKIMHQAAMLQNYQQEIYDLRNHLASVKQHQQMMVNAQIKQRQNELAAQQVYWKKVKAMKTNSTVEHLWQIKQVEYHNINQIFRSILQKQHKT